MFTLPTTQLQAAPWPPPAFKLTAVISSTRSTYMLRTEMVYKRRLVDESYNEVYLTIGGKDQLITLTPVYGKYRHAAPIHFMAMIVNTKTLRSDIVVIQPGQLLEIR